VSRVNTVIVEISSLGQGSKVGHPAISIWVHRKYLLDQDVSQNRNPIRPMTDVIVAAICYAPRMATGVHPMSKQGLPAVRKTDKHQLPLPFERYER